MDGSIHPLWLRCNIGRSDCLPLPPIVLLLLWQIFQRTTTDPAPARPARRNCQNGEEPEQLVSSSWDEVVVVEVVVGLVVVVVVVVVVVDL